MTAKKTNKWVLKKAARCGQRTAE